MYDNLKIVFTLHHPLWEVMIDRPRSFKYCGMKFRYKGRGRYAAILGNLYVEILGDQVTVENSWHKFFLSHNVWRYTMLDLEETIQVLSIIFRQDVSRASVIGDIEFGVNIETEHTHQHRNWLSVRKREPVIIYDKKHKARGRSFYWDKFHIKGYDKTAEYLDNAKKVDPEVGSKRVFRIEMVAEKTYLNHMGCRLEKVSDLLDKDNLRIMIDLLCYRYDSITLDHDIDYSSINLEDCKLIGLSKDMNLKWAAMNKCSPRTRRRHEVGIERIRKEHGMRSNLISAKQIREEWNHLLKN